MPNAEKTEKVAALKKRIGGSHALLLAEYRGLSVHDATELRRSLADDARFAIVKNTLMQRAATEAGIDDLEALLAGPTAVAFVDGDVVAVAKRVVDAAKKFPALVLKGAYLDGRVLSAAEAQQLATLESREVMLSKIAGLLKMEMSRAASTFQALQSRFLGVLEAYKEKLPGEVAPEQETVGGEPEAASVEPEAASAERDAAPADADAPAETEPEAVAAEAEASTETTEASIESEAGSSDAAADAAVDGDDGEPPAESGEAPGSSDQTIATEASASDETTSEEA
jgi:large subunit ribosomal protein L10